MTGLRRRRRALGALGLVLTLACGGLAGASWWHRRSTSAALSPPAVPTDAAARILPLILPDYPETLPWLACRTGHVRAVEGRIDAVAAVSEAHTGRELWGVAYTWLAAPDRAGGRAALPGFAIVAPPTATSPGKRVYTAPPIPGWDGDGDGAFESTVEVTAAVEAVQWSPRDAGFLVRHGVEASLGGRLGRGIARAFVSGIGGWELAWEHPTLERERPDRSVEVSREASVEAVDLDGLGERVLAVSPSWYIRELRGDDRGIHFTADGPGRFVHRREGSQFRQAQFDAGAGKLSPLRPTTPLYAVRTARAPTIDASFADWDAVEVSRLGLVMMDHPSQLRWQTRPLQGSHDFSGAVRLLWDDAALYLRVEVMDDVLSAAPAGRLLYQGDHVGLWIDRELERDFDRRTRDLDDWQLGLAPGAGTRGRAVGGQGWTWVPLSGERGLRVASAPLVDPNDMAVRGWQLEAAVPWQAIGGTPAVGPMAGMAGGDPRTELQARRYRLHAAGLMGLAIVLTDADERPQEAAYATSRGLEWGQPRTFNPLLLVEALPAR
ncbi:MAG: sugar-binding protein [Candidatus Sericytochromatia bacterium]|nr:sugar-binding protein [Candidatus Sericytochromatia bacterium]